MPFLLLRFLRNLPDYYLENRNRYRRAELRLPDNTVFHTADRWFFTPNNLVIWKLWNQHCTARFIRPEITDFIELARGCSKFLDVGASSGGFSAIFNEMFGGATHSLEPDPASYGFLLESVRLNTAKTGNNAWIPAQLALSNVDGKARFISDSGYGGTLAQLDEQDSSGNRHLVDEDVKVMTLESYCREADFYPDLIKFDIESHEFEVILGSLDFLRSRRPKLHLELHNDLLKARGEQPGRVLDALFAIGYRVRSPRLSVGALLKQDVARIDLAGDAAM